MRSAQISRGFIGIFYYVQNFFILQSGSCSHQNGPAAFCSLPGIRFQFNFVSQTSVFWLLVRIFPRQIPLIILTQFFTDGQTSFLKTFI